MGSRAARPVIVAGMHRSGTSLVASWIEALGIDVGQQLLPADGANTRGYFEDRAFLELQQRMMRDATREGDGGHRDWGWTESEHLDRQSFARHSAAAKALVDERRSSGRAWGWKDPRTTLALDFWHEIVPDARYVFVYRRPWDVADSIERLGADVFVARPDYAYRIWSFYNRALLDFQARRAEACLLLSVHALVEDPERAAAAMVQHLGAAPATSARRAIQLLERSLLRTIPLDDPIVALRRAIDPGSFEILAALDARARLPGRELSVRAARAPATPVTTPRLSVVIPFHNDGELVIEAVASVERSVPFPCEVLIVNDGSTEPLSLRTLDLLRRAGHTVVDQAPCGLAAARNHGFKAARAPFVLPLDSDNRLLPGFIEPALSALEQDPRAGVAYGDRNEFGPQRRLVRVPEFDVFTLLQGNYIDACAVVRKSVWEACGGYDEQMSAPGWEDWSLWMGAAALDWRFLHFATPAFDYRVRSASMSSRLLQPGVGEAVQSYLVRKHEDLYRRFLPELLRRAQDFNRLRKEGASEQKEEEALGADRAAMQRELAALRDWARQHLEACGAGAAAGEHEREALQRDNAALHEELAHWRDRVQAMESTKAWKLRSALLRARRALGR